MELHLGWEYSYLVKHPSVPIACRLSKIPLQFVFLNYCKSIELFRQLIISIKQETGLGSLPPVAVLVSAYYKSELAANVT